MQPQQFRDCRAGTSVDAEQCELGERVETTAMVEDIVALRNIFEQNMYELQADQT